MDYNDNIPSRLLNHFSTPAERKKPADNEAFTDAVISLLIDMPESEFRWDEQKQVYICTVAGMELKLRESSYRGLKYLKKVKSCGS